MASYTYVCIPAAEDEPMYEITASGEGGFENDSLKKGVSAHYASKLAVSDEAVAAAKEAELRAALAGAGQAVPSADLLASALAPSRGVEITLLTVPKAPTFQSVSLYSDPDASAKSSPVNFRATSLAGATGHPETTLIRGDAFVSRCVDNERTDVWMRVNMPLSDVSPNAPWVREAASSNRGKSMAGWSSSGGLATALSGMQAPSAPAATGVDSSASGWADGDDADGGYSWRVSGGSGGEVEVRVWGLPVGTRAKDVDVVLTSTRCGVRAKAQSGVPAEGGCEPRMSMKGGSVLYGRIDKEESSWAVETGVRQAGRTHPETAVVLTLVRTDGLADGPWPTLFKSDAR